MLDRATIKYIISTLRAASVTWSGRTLCLNRGRRERVVGKFKSGKDKFVWENNCECCGIWKDQKDNYFEVDHIDMIGSFNGSWDEYIPRMFCDQDNLQRLCNSCHTIKTNIGNSTLRFHRKEVLNALDYL
jgi:hypothetical protein